MLDFMAITKALPEVTKLVPQVQEFIAAWTQFMHTLVQDLKWLRGAAETADNKISLVIRQNDELDEKLTMFMAETSLTQDMQNDIERMSMSDPRNADLRPAWVDDSGRGLIFMTEIPRREDMHP